jgi:hypothetical protein
MEQIMSSMQDYFACKIKNSDFSKSNYLIITLMKSIYYE